MNPEMSVSVPSQPAKQPHTLLSPQQFSLSEETPPLSHTPPPPEPLGPPLSREQLKQALLSLIQVATIMQRVLTVSVTWYFVD